MTAISLAFWLVLRLPAEWAWLLGAGGATFLFFGFDKRRARAAAGRVPERVLQAMALFGGVAGGWAGMLLLRHKTRKPAFWAVQWLATTIWGGIALWRADYF